MVMEGRAAVTPSAFACLRKSLSAENALRNTCERRFSSNSGVSAVTWKRRAEGGRVTGPFTAW